MGGSGNLPIGPGIWGFIAFFVLAIALWLLVRNMNSRLRRMAYRDREDSAASLSGTPADADGAATDPDGAATDGDAPETQQTRGAVDEPDEPGDQAGGERGPGTRAD
ncbi:hypothetical protein ACFQU3_04720 [Terrabacter sp. GCM10028922]|uniref:hypothetical protein n=1 Tax=Terrabacter sp. GCM10028922 TaxID=3273428 RepID=UPI003618EA8C